MAETTQNTPGRKPGQATRPLDVVALENAGKSISRILWYVQQNPADHLGQRLARCAKAGVARERAEAGLAMVEKAVALARTQFEAAYAAPIKPEAGEPRATRPTVSL